MEEFTSKTSWLHMITDDKTYTIPTIVLSMCNILFSILWGSGQEENEQIRTSNLNGLKFQRKRDILDKTKEVGARIRYIF